MYFFSSPKEYYAFVGAVLLGCGLVFGASYLKSEIKTVALADGMTENISRKEALRHVYGNKNAEVTVVEFSDFSCRFCSLVHETLRTLVDESNANVVWEYRHLPILREESFTAALASECVSELKGNDAFWQFADTIMASQANLNDAYIKDTVLTLGITNDEYTSCLQNEDLRARVESDAELARSLGARGTPYSVVISKDGTKTPVSGALPLSEFKALIN